MRCDFRSSLLLVLFLLAACFLLSDGKGGRGGGSRGGSSRGSSSRGSTSSRGSSDRYNSRNRPSNSPPPPKSPVLRPSPPPKYRPSAAPARPSPRPRPSPQPARPSPQPPKPSPQPPKPSANPKPSAPESSDIKPSEPKVVNQQPAYNPNFKESNPVQSSPNQSPVQSSPNQSPYNPNHGSGAQNPQKPPPYEPQARPPPYAPGGPPPPYGPGGQPSPHGPGGQPPPYAPGGPPPPYSPQGQPGVNPYPQQPGATYPGAAYPRQPGAPYPQQPGAPYPQQPGAPYPQQPGAPYPRQPGAPYPQQPGAPYPQQPGAPYPRQPGAPYPQQPGAPYPRQPGFNQPYPQQPGMHPNQLGANVWRPNSGMPAPSYMQSGGLPTGANMYQKPLKKKGFLGSIFSMGHSSPKGPKKPKYYGSHPNPYGQASMGKHGMSAPMYTMLPYMANRKSGGMFKPKFRMPMIIPIFIPFGGFGHHHHGYGYGNNYGHTHYDVYNDEYVGRCNRPLTPEHSAIHCVATNRQVNCDISCPEGYRFADNSTRKENRCWHATGVWRPTKNFPGCQAVCNDTCLNGGKCDIPGHCECLAENRGPRCEYHFLQCNIIDLAKKNKIGWACSHTKFETVCRVRCRPPLKFATPSADKYHCSPEGKWTPDFMPECIADTEDTEDTKKSEDEKISVT